MTSSKSEMNFQIAPEKLAGKSNYDSWARSARMAIASQKRIGYITGTKTAPAERTGAAYETWEENNCLVQSWLLSAMEKHVRALFDRLPTAKAIWDAADKTYSIGKKNSSKIFDLTRRSISVKQNGRSLEAYYEELHTIWQELVAISSHGIKNAEDLAAHQKTITDFRVYVFLAGLDSHLDDARAHVLRSETLPDVLEVYASICEEELRLKTMMEDDIVSALSTNKGFRSSSRPPPYRPPPQRSAPFKASHAATPFKPAFKPLTTKVAPNPLPHNSLKGERVCSYCNGDHIVEKCWKLHGKPDWADDLMAKKYGHAPHANFVEADESGHANHVKTGESSPTLADKPGMTSYALCTSATTCTDAWIIDIGATDHMTNDPTKFVTFSIHCSKLFITNANG